MVNWIMVTMNDNGERIEYLSEGRRLRQGDPVSPHLFTLVMEVLNLLLKKNIKESGKLSVKYLGVLLVTKQISITDCKPLVENVRKKVMDWKNKALTYASVGKYKSKGQSTAK
ncbi:hypothetical protein Tco_0239564 [Tanacetum coccineum]